MIKHKTKSFIKVIAFISIMTMLSSLFFAIPIKASAKGTSIRSWLADFLNPTFTIVLNDGDLLFKNTDKRKEINNDINSGNATKEYSMYDRFGPNINFFTYLGEVKIQTNIIDKIYTVMINNGSMGISDVMDIFKSDSHSVNNVVYDNRVDISNSNQDPRYVAWSNSTGLGGNTSVGNFYLTIGKFVNEIFSFVITGKLFDVFIDKISLINDDLQDTLKTIMKTLFTMVLIFVAVNLLRFLIKYLKGSMGSKAVFSKGMYGLLASLIILAFGAAPLKLLPIVQKIVDIKDSIFEYSMEQVIDNNVVNNSEDPIEASLWYINVFNPWCQGMYGTTYDKMYTKYAIDTDGISEDNTLPMSDDNILERFKDEYRYSCKDTCGDVKIPLGNSKYERNWAALGWSIQSIYHIGAIKGTNGSTTWPNAETTIKNNNIYIDDLRYIDAITNISEEYCKTGKTTGNIPSSGKNAPRAYGTSYMIKGGLLSAYRSIFLTLPLFLFSIRAFLYLVNLSFAGLNLTFNSVMYSLKMRDEGPLSMSFKKLIQTLMNWFIMNVMFIFALNAYMSMYNTLIGNIVYMAICLILYFEAPTLSRRTQRIKDKMNNRLNHFGKYVKNKVSQKATAK